MEVRKKKVSYRYLVLCNDIILVTKIKRKNKSVAGRVGSQWRC